MSSAREELKALEIIGAEKLARGELIRNDDKLEPYLATIKQALITKREKEQALKIIMKKNVDVAVIKTSDNVRAYNFETRFKRFYRDELTQEEYDLVSKVVKEIEEK